MGFGKKTGISQGGREPPPEPSPCQVETYSGSRLHEQPRRFTFQGKWLEVRRILAQWLEPEELCFLVAADEACPYLLKYHRRRDAWQVQVWPGPAPNLP